MLWTLPFSQSSIKNILSFLELRKYFEWIKKELLNSAWVWYEELCRSRRVLSALIASLICIILHIILKCERCWMEMLPPFALDLKIKARDLNAQRTFIFSSFRNQEHTTNMTSDFNKRCVHNWLKNVNIKEWSVKFQFFLLFVL